MGFVFEGEEQERFEFEDEDRFVIEEEKHPYWDKTKDVYEHLLKPTAKTAVKVPLSIAGSMAAFPASGVAGYSKLLTSGPEEAAQTIEDIQQLPMRWIKTPAEQEALSYITKPLEWVETAAEFYGDKAHEVTGNWAIGAGVKTAFEMTAFFGLPSLANKLRLKIKGRHTEAIKQGVREVHKERLRILEDEPNRLKTLVQKEEALKTQRENVGSPLLHPDRTPIKSKTPKTLKTNVIKRPEPPFSLERGTPKKKGVTVEEFAQRLSEEGEKPHEARAFEEQYLTEGEKRVAKTTRELKQNQRKGGGTTLSFGGVTPETFYGDRSLVPDLWEAYKKVGAGLIKSLDVEAPWKKIDAAETGFQVKNYFSQRALHEEYGLVKGKENTQLFNYDRNLAPDVVLGYENPKWFKKLPKTTQKKIGKAVKHFGDFFKKYQREYKKRGIDIDFKKRIINDIEQLIGENVKGEDLAALKDALKNIKETEFVHIPSAMWFNDLMTKDPVGGNSLLRMLATQKRKTFSIQSLIDSGAINKADIHPADIMASYARRAGNDFALLNMVEAAKADGLASVAPKAGYVKIPAYRAPILAKYHVHPLIAEHVFNLTKHRTMNPLEMASVSVKMAAFHNPLFLPGYDVVQGVMLGSFRSTKTPKHIGQAIKDVWSKTPEYWEALDNGLASKPYNNPYKSWKGMIEGIKKTNGEKVAGILENALPHTALKNVYNLSWHIAWQLDKTVRMVSYRHLLEKGFTPREAAQIAARYHADYASVPVGTRKVLNHLFFTPTFKITMAKLHGQMVMDAAKSFKKFGKVDKTTKVYAKGLGATAGIMVGWDMFMRSQGFESDQWGYRYSKRVETDEGPKDLTVTWSNPANMFLKYIHRARGAMEPQVERPILEFLKKNKWEYNRLAQIGYEVASGESAAGDEIYSTFDSTPAKLAKSLLYTVTRTLPILDAIGLDSTEANVEAREQFKKETSQLLEAITRPFTFKYMRTPSERRGYYKLKQIQKQFNKLIWSGNAKPRHVEAYRKKLIKVLQGLEK